VARATESLFKQIAELRGRTPASISDEDRSRFADVQARADVAFSAFSIRAPSPLLNEQLGDYRRRMATANPGRGQLIRLPPQTGGSVRRPQRCQPMHSSGLCRKAAISRHSPERPGI
jgi:hypothetical protein